MKIAPAAVLAANVLVAAAFAPLALAAESSFHPSKAVTLIVPYSAGGGTDAIGRLFAKQLGALWGQTVIVDNRTGGNGSIGSYAVARAAPDGQTLLLAVSSIVINPYVMSKLPYETKTAFTPITPLAYSVVVLVGSPTLKVNDAKGLIALAKQEPGVHTFASSEPATRLTAERIFHAGNARLTHIPYKGAAQWLTDVMAGTVDVGIASITSAQAFMKEGKIKVLGIAGEQRSEMLPNVPTFKEQGIPGLETNSWYGLFAPGGTPAPVVAALYADISRVLAMPEVKAQLATYGALPGGEAPDAFAKRFQRELVENGELTREIGIKAE
jgi:tripartite-type tricarboxylate transporter receptor subunit TctC